MQRIISPPAALQPQQARSPVAPSRGFLPKWGYLEWFIVLQFALPAVLCIRGAQQLRVPLRAMPFLLSILPLYLFMQKSYARQVPGRRMLIAMLAWLAASIFHPTTNTILAGIAQTLMNVSVIAPVFWVPQLIKGTRHIERLLIIIMICNGASAAVGVLQVHYPDRFMPAEFSKAYGAEYLADMTYEGADGSSIIRPPGLSDAPGAACGAGVGCATLGLIFLMGGRTSMPMRLLCMATIIVGTSVIYFTLVRTSILILGGSSLIFCAIQLRQGKGKTAIAGIALSAIALAGGLAYAISVGGEKVETRYKSLFEARPTEVFYKSRGVAVEHAFNELLFEYPLGAGLGRWGQMRGYFGDESNTASPPLFAEIQFPAWILDGGIPLLIMYIVAILIMMHYIYQVATVRSDRDVQHWAGAVLAMNSGTVALCLSYAPFNSQLGTFFWLQSGLVLGAAIQYRASVRAS